MQDAIAPAACTATVTAAAAPPATTTYPAARLRPRQISAAHDANTRMPANPALDGVASGRRRYESTPGATIALLVVVTVSVDRTADAPGVTVSGLNVHVVRG